MPAIDNIHIDNKIDSIGYFFEIPDIVEISEFFSKSSEFSSQKNIQKLMMPKKPIIYARKYIFKAFILYSAIPRIAIIMNPEFAIPEYAINLLKFF